MEPQYKIKKVAETTVSAGDGPDSLQVRVEICEVRMVIGETADPCVQLSSPTDFGKLMRFLEGYETSWQNPQDL